MEGSLGWQFIFDYPVLPEKKVIRLQEIMAIVLNHIAANAHRTTSVNIEQAVLTIPANDLSIHKRKQLLSVFDLAGIKPLRFVGENVAAGIRLALQRKEEDPERKVLIVNVGSSSVKLSVLKYSLKEKKLSDNVKINR